MTYVYALYDGENVKVGKTKVHPERRRKQLQTGSSRALRLLAYTQDMPELLAHRRLSRWRLGGEWFRATAGSLAEVGSWSWVDWVVWREACISTTGASEVTVTPCLV